MDRRHYSCLTGEDELEPMSELDVLRAQIASNTILAQRNQALEAVALLSGDLAVANKRVADLEARVKELEAQQAAKG